VPASMFLMMMAIQELRLKIHNTPAGRGDNTRAAATHDTRAGRRTSHTGQQQHAERQPKQCQVQAESPMHNTPESLLYHMAAAPLLCIYCWQLEFLMGDHLTCPGVMRCGTSVMWLKGFDSGLPLPALSPLQFTHSSSLHMQSTKAVEALLPPALDAASLPTAHVCWLQLHRHHAPADNANSKSRITQLCAHHDLLCLRCRAQQHWHRCNKAPRK
jgi:hypothetical protein